MLTQTPCRRTQAFTVLRGIVFVASVHTFVDNESKDPLHLTGCEEFLVPEVLEENAFIAIAASSAKTARGKPDCAVNSFTTLSTTVCSSSRLNLPFFFVYANRSRHALMPDKKDGTGAPVQITQQYPCCVAHGRKTKLLLVKPFSGQQLDHHSPRTKA